MGKKIFINLPVKDLKRTASFFSRLGYSFNPQFSDEKAKCMIISDDIYVMLLTEPFFTSFTGKDVPDTKTSSEVILSLQADSREGVDTYLERCISGGAKDLTKPQTMDFMYTRSFEDPDGHIWEVFWMDMAKVTEQQPAQTV
ncbi:MAG TPA: VOC family protein [Bacteroidales bacterium]|jgi:predicted lactoylglutathione lyase|nr:VOC family protein [Bacteroidales bacterium]